MTKVIGRYLFIGVSTCLVLFAFQNCGDMNSFQVRNELQTQSMTSTGSVVPVEDPSSDGLQSTGDVCEDQLYATFFGGYYPMLRNNCVHCHDGKSEAPAFATSSSLASFKVFKDKGYLAVSNNAVNPNHNPPYTGTHLTELVTSLKSEWGQAQGTWDKCKGTAPDTSLVTSPKANSNIFANKTNTALWNSISWNLNSEMPAKSALFPLVFSIEIQAAHYAGEIVGYALRNPQMQISSGTKKYLVQGTYFYLNGKLFDAATTYRSIKAVVCAGTPLNLAPVGNAELMVVPTISPTDKFAVQISSITEVPNSTVCGTGYVPPTVDTTPASVSYTQLTSTDATLGIFKAKCYSCHAGAGSAVSVLNIADYDQAKNKANKILIRINDSSSPMPPTGLISSSATAIVQKWISLGTPK